MTPIAGKGGAFSIDKWALGRATPCVNLADRKEEAKPKRGLLKSCEGTFTGTYDPLGVPVVFNIGGNEYHGHAVAFDDKGYPTLILMETGTIFRFQVHTDEEKADIEKIIHGDPSAAPPQGILNV